MALNLRIITVKLLQIVIKYLNSNKNFQEIDSQKIQKISFEIMVITTRMCLDKGSFYIGFLKEIGSDTSELISKLDRLEEDNYLIYLYYLNDLQIYKYDIDNVQKFKI